MIEEPGFSRERPGFFVFGGGRSIAEALGGKHAIARVRRAARLGTSQGAGLMRAQCQCGQLTVELPGPSPAVVACHCIACQRRSGSPFGVLAYYPEDLLTVAGEGKRFERATDEGSRFETVFCPECGSTVYARTAKHPSMIGVAVGAIADRTFPAPVRSVWEESMHHWVTVPGEVQHFAKGRV
jgi:hypothetical protein